MAVPLGQQARARVVDEDEVVEEEEVVVVVA